MERRLTWPSCTNIRDLGGYRVAGRETTWRSIIRADNLNRLTDDGRASLVSYGVRTVIDLRDPREVERFPYPFRESDLPGVTVLNVPLISAANWKAINSADRGHPYVLIARLSAPNIVDALRTIALAPPGGVVVHCHEGRERTGVVAALILHIAGVDDAAIASDWVASQPESLRPEDILPVLEYARTTHGSVMSYLAAYGLSGAEVTALRARLLD